MPASPAPVRRVVAATDRSDSADYAAAWAAEMAARYEAELVLVQVVAPAASPAEVETRELERLAAELAGARGSARVVTSEDPPGAIVTAAEEADADVLVVGNVGMSGRKEFLLGNVPNRVSHGARCTVVIVSSAEAGERRTGLGRLLRRP